MRTLLSQGSLVLTLMVIAPAVGYAGPAADANAVIDQLVAAFTANDAEAVVRLYAPGAITCRCGHDLSSVSSGDSMTPPRAQRRYCALCGRAFAIVMPPGEQETERGRFWGVCAPLLETPDQSQA